MAQVYYFPRKASPLDASTLICKSRQVGQEALRPGREHDARCVCDLRSRILPGLQVNPGFVISEKNTNQAQGRGPNKDTGLCT